MFNEEKKKMAIFQQKIGETSIHINPNTFFKKSVLQNKKNYFFKDMNLFPLKIRNLETGVVFSQKKIEKVGENESFGNIKVCEVEKNPLKIGICEKLRIKEKSDLMMDLIEKNIMDTDLKNNLQFERIEHGDSILEILRNQRNHLIGETGNSVKEFEKKLVKESNWRVVEGICKGMENVYIENWRNSFILIRHEKCYFERLPQWIERLDPVQIAVKKWLEKHFSLNNNCSQENKSKNRVEKRPKIAVIDWGVGHSQNLESEFYQDPNTLIISFGIWCLNDSENNSSELLKKIGSNAGLGYNLNLPLKSDDNEILDDTRYIFLFERMILPILKEFSPDLVLIKNGLRSLFGSPVLKMELSGDGKNLIFFIFLNIRI